MLRAFYDIAGECGMPRPPFDKWKLWATENAEFWPITHTDGTLIGGVLFKDHTVHIAVHPDWHGRWISKKLLKAYRTWEPECDVYATPAADNLPACNLAERLGFERIGDNGLNAIYVKRGTPCQP